VQAFLPELEASNSVLAQRVQVDPKSVDIEHVDESMDQYIEMVRPLSILVLYSLIEWNRTLVSAFLKIVLTGAMKMKTQRCPRPQHLTHLNRRTMTRMLTRIHPLKSSPRSTQFAQSSPFPDANRIGLVLTLLSWANTLRLDLDAVPPNVRYGNWK
jgi:hypothetical protein